MTQVFLDQEFDRGRTPFEDDYQRAEERALYWLSAGWFTPEEVREWLHRCPNVSPDVAVSLANAGVPPRLANLRLWYRKVESDRPPLYMQIGANQITVERAVEWLRERGLLAA